MNQVAANVEDDAQVHHHAGGEDDGVFLAHQFGQLALQLDVDVEGAVQEA